MFSLDALFCDVDDFCQSFEPQWKTRLLHHGGIKRIRAKSLCLSEIMTILIAFHRLGARSHSEETSLGSHRKTIIVISSISISIM